MKEFIKEWLFILIISLILIVGHSCSLIRVHYNFHYTTNKAQIFIGQQSLRNFVIVDLTCQYTWINALGDSSSELSRLNDVQLLYNHNHYIGKETQDLLGFDSNHTLLKQFNYYFITQSSQGKERALPRSNGVLGLAYSFPDVRYSLVHQLKGEGLIDHLSFSIVHKNQLYFGGIPTEISSSHYHSDCNVIDHNNTHNEGHWRCALFKVIIKSKNKTLTYRNRKQGTVTFTADADLNYAPRSFISFLKNHFYSEEICSKYFRVDNRDGADPLCSPDDGSSIKYGNITFAIGNYSYTVDIGTFWNCYEIVCDFTLYGNPYGDYWMLGVSFYKMFHVQFDYEEKKIIFYSKKQVLPYEDIEETEEIKAMLILNGLLLSIGVFSIFWRKRK